MTLYRSPLLASCALIACCTLAACSGASDRPQPGEIKLTAAFDADFELIDHYGAPATDERFDGKPMLIYFGFTTCPDVCPAALGTLTTTLDRLGNQADKIQPLFITVDPGRDDVERMANHLAYDPRILGLTGSETALKAAQAAMNVYAAKTPLPDSAMEYTMDHQRLFYLTDAEGTPILAFPDSLPAESVVAIVRRVL